MALRAERLAPGEAAVPRKAREGVAAGAPTRYAAVIDKIRSVAATAGFDPEIAEAMWRVMTDAQIARAARVLGQDGADA